MPAIIDAALYPHIVDLIVEEVCWRYDASSWRLVSRAWKARTDLWLGKHIAISDFGGFSLTAPRVAARTEWTAHSCLRPSISYALPRIPGGRSTSAWRGGRDLAAKAQVIDWIGLCGVDAFAAAILEDAENVHTVRIQGRGEIQDVLALQHVRRVVYGMMPFPSRDRRWHPDQDVPSSACGDSCDRPDRHTSKIVVNVRGADVDDDPVHMELPTLQEMVFIIHPWKNANPFDLDQQMTRDGVADPRTRATTLAAWAVEGGARVTVVNGKQLDFFTNRFSGEDWMKKQVLNDRLKQMVGLIIGADSPALENIRSLSTDEYIAEIGLREFQLEAMLDRPSGCRWGSQTSSQSQPKTFASMLY